MLTISPEQNTSSQIIYSLAKSGTAHQQKSYEKYFKFDIFN